MEAKNADSEDESSSSISYKSGKGDKRPREEGKGSDTLITNDPSSTSDTISETKALTKHSSQSQSLPADAARSKKKPKKSAFRGKFLQQLRVLLDRESQIESTIVQWTADGNSFIIMDQSQFESDVIPTYFDNPIAFSSFVNKLSRWGFKRVPTKQIGRVEYSSPTFRRSSASRVPAAAAAASNSTENAASQLQASLLEAMAQGSPPPLPNANQQQSNAAAILNLISSIQRVSQQLNIPTQQPVPNQNTNQPNADDANRILQSIMSTIQQPPQTQQHPTPAPAPAPAVNMFNNYGGGQAPQAHLQGYPQGNNAVNALMSLSGMLSQQQTHPNTNSTASIPQLNNDMSVQSLMMLLSRVREEERQRRAQADEIKNAIIAQIVQIIALSNSIVETERELHSRGFSTVPPNVALHPRQVDRPPSAAATVAAIPSVQASSSNYDRIAAILQAIRNDNAGQLEAEAEAGDDRERSNGHRSENRGQGG